MRDIPPTENMIKCIIYDICKHIQQLHSNNYIHVDIKPSNILYCQHGTYLHGYQDKQTFKLIDFDGMVWNRTMNDEQEIIGQGLEVGFQGIFKLINIDHPCT